MVWQRVQFILLAGIITAVATFPARADDCCSPCPSTCTVRVKEWVPQTYQATRTCYRTECREEKYTAYRCECVPETRTRTCTVYRSVSEVRNETRNVCVCVPVVETRTVTQQYVTCKPVTRTVRKCVDRGHWECREVCCKPSFWARLKRHCHKRDCCECSCPPPTKTVRVWVPCKVWEECPITCYERVCESRPVTCKVTTWKQEVRQEKYQVTCWRCVPEERKENYQVLVSHKVAYQATRSVAVCVPYQQTYTACRMVCREVEKQVTASTCCETTCCKPSCGHKCHWHHHHGCCN
ncbi:MAG TPA: hypothetical protein VG013_32445 [Gemmataceae bacterium]|jgi:hypothetical protein|nr:hypothetical protein [Gemmataceae bacterium]